MLTRKGEWQSVRDIDGGKERGEEVGMGWLCGLEGGLIYMNGETILLDWELTICL